MNSAESFSASYQQARARFCEAAAAAGTALERIAHPGTGPDGGDLSTDVALAGPRDAERVLVMISGTHGVEGFCGSGAQVDWLRRGEAQRLPDGLAVLMIHAINPHGFAWLRRTTEDNVDLNRNWVDFAAPPRANPGYDELAGEILPDAWDAASQAKADAALRRYAEVHGAARLQHALTAGQYRHPGGIFYGGREPSWSRRTQSAIYQRHLAGAGKVAIIDYHTGLGPWGYGEQIITEPPDSQAFRRAAAWFGACVVSPSAGGGSSSADIKGDGLSAAPALLPQAEVTGMALEIGTVPLAETLAALRADAWLHARGDPGSPAAGPIKAEIRRAFYGDADDWKGMVAAQSLLVTRQAIAGLCR